MKKLSKEHRKKLSIAQIKRFSKIGGLPEGIKRKISTTKKMKYASGEIVVWNKGKKRPPFSQEWKKNISKALKGHKSHKKQIQATILRNKTRNPMWNPKIVKKAVKSRNYQEIIRKGVETRERNGTHLEYSKRMKKNNPMKNPLINAKVNKNPEVMKKRIQALIKTPNKQETLLLQLIKKYKLPYKFMGDGKLIIGTKNPDFINPNKKEIIEIFGDYWHTKKVRCYEETEEGRIKYFEKYGYKTLVIWERELKNPQEVIEKITNFRI